MSTWVLISVEIVFLFYVFLLFCVLAFLLGFQCFHHNIVFPVFVGCCLAKTSVFFTVVGWLLSNERNPMCSSGFGCFSQNTGFPYVGGCLHLLSYESTGCPKVFACFLRKKMFSLCVGLVSFEHIGFLQVFSYSTVLSCESSHKP